MLTTLTATEKRLQRQLDEFTERLSREVAPFRDTSTDAVRERYYRTRRDTEAFGRTYTPHYFDAPSAAFHTDLDAMLEADEREVYVVHGPREHAKSSRARVNLLRQFVNGDLRYYLFGSEHLNLSKKHVEAFHVELTQNVRLLADYRIVVQKWESDEGILQARITPRATGKSHTIRLEAISYGTSAKGRLFIHIRPQGALVDDFENTRTARNEKISREKLQWVLQELYPAVTGPVVWLGNVGHETSALYLAMLRCHQEDDEALRAFLRRGTAPGSLHTGEARSLASDSVGQQSEAVADLGADEGEGAAGDAPKARLSCYAYRAEYVDEETGEVTYLWAERYDARWYAEMRLTMAHYYEGEMNGYPVRVGLFFKAEWFPRYEELPKDVHLAVYAWFDPSFGKSGKNCYRVIVIVATDGKDYYVVAAWARQTDPISDALDWWYEQFERYPLMSGGYENTFGQDDRLAHDLDDAAERHGYPLPAAGDANPGLKEARIESLQPLASGHRIHFPARMDSDVKVVWDHVTSYPDGAYSDGADALEGAIKRCRRGPGDRPMYQPLSTRRYVRGPRRR